MKSQIIREVTDTDEDEVDYELGDDFRSRGLASGLSNEISPLNIAGAQELKASFEIPSADMKKSVLSMEGKGNSSQKNQKSKFSKGPAPHTLGRDPRLAKEKSNKQSSQPAIIVKQSSTKHTKKASNDDIRLHVSSPPETVQFTSGPQEDGVDPEAGENKMSLGALLKQLREQKAKERSKIMSITSNNKFYEIFNKRTMKCQGVNVCETVFIGNGGNPVAWYFLSANALQNPEKSGYCLNYVDELQKKYGAVLKKNHSKLADETLYISLYNNSLIGKFGIEQFQDIVDFDESKTDLYRRIQTLLKSKITPEDIKDIHNLTLTFINAGEFRDVDAKLPMIAYVRFFDKEEKKSKGYKPLELLTLVYNEKLNGVKVIQPFVYAAGTDLVAPMQTVIVADYVGPGSKIEEKNVPKQFETHIQLYKVQNPHKRNKNEQDEYVKYFNKGLMAQIIPQIKSLVRFIQQANGGVRVTSLRAKFIEQQSFNDFDTKEPILVFIGLSKEIGIDARGTPLEDVHVNGQNFFFSKDIKDGNDYIFSADVIKPYRKDAKTLPVDPTVGCAGQFCNYLKSLIPDDPSMINHRSTLPLTFESHTQLTLNLTMNMKAREELEKQSQLIPKRNKLSINQTLSDGGMHLSKTQTVASLTEGSFLVTGLLIKKVKDNQDLAYSVLQKHFAPLINTYINSHGSPSAKKSSEPLLGHSPARRNHSYLPKISIKPSESGFSQNLKVGDMNDSKDISSHKSGPKGSTYFVSGHPREDDTHHNRDSLGSTTHKHHTRTHTDHDFNEHIGHVHHLHAGENALPPRVPKAHKMPEEHIPSHWIPVKRKHKQVVRNTYDQLYSGVKVCRKCHEIYLLLQDYFDELNEHITGKAAEEARRKAAEDYKKNETLRKSKEFTERERSGSISQLLKEARAFSHTNLQLTYLEKSKLKGGETRNKSLIQETLSHVQVANMKGDVILSGKLEQSGSKLAIEGFTRVNEQLMKRYNGKNTDLGKHMSGTTIKRKVQDSLTQSQIVKMKPQISLKIVTVNAVVKKEQSPELNMTKDKSRITLKNQQHQQQSSKSIESNNTLLKQSMLVKSQMNLQPIMEEGVYKTVSKKKLNNINSHSVESIKSLKEKEDQAQRMASVKTLFAIAMQNMFHKQEVKFYHEKAKEIEEHRKVINFFLEVSKNVPKYILAIDYFDNVEKTIAGANSARGKRRSGANNPRSSDPPQQLKMKNVLSLFGESTDTPPKQMSLFKNAAKPAVSPRTKEDPKLYSRALKEQAERNDKKKTMMLQLEKEQKEAHELFKGSKKLSNLIMQRLQNMISQQINKLAVQPAALDQNGRSHSLTHADDKQTRDFKNSAQNVTIPLKSSRVQAVEYARFVPNITVSLFHHTNLAHMQHIPFYRISTPKAPIYTLEEQRNPLRKQGANSARKPAKPFQLKDASPPKKPMLAQNVSKKSIMLSNGTIIDPVTQPRASLLLANGFSGILKANNNVTQSQDLNNKDSPSKKKLKAIEEQEEDDIYIIPQENYQTMAIENYIDLLNDKKYRLHPSEEVKRLFDKLEREGVQVFFCDEHTSLLYVILQNTIETHRSSDEEIESHHFSQDSDSDDDLDNRSSVRELKRKKAEREKLVDTYLVLLDFYDTFLDKIEYFSKMLTNDKVRLVLINMPGQQLTQFNSKKNLNLNNMYYANCLDLLLYHLNERGCMNFLDKLRGGTYSLIGFGNGANIALYYAQMMINDTTSTLKSLILINPYTHTDKSMRRSLMTSLECVKMNQNDDNGNDLVLFDHILHSSEHAIVEGTVEEFKVPQDNKWEWNATLKEKSLMCQGVLQNIPLQDKLGLFKEAGSISEKPLDIKVLYSKTNQLVTYRQIEELLKLTHDKRSKDSAVARLTVIGGGHDVLRDNPTEVRDYLVEIFESNYLQQTKRDAETVVENLPKQPSLDTQSIQEGGKIGINDRSLIKSSQKVSQRQEGSAAEQRQQPGLFAMLGNALKVDKL